MSWFQSYVSHCRLLPLGEFNGMSSQSHVSHCRLLPLGEFIVTIPEQHATLQGAVTWRNDCHGHATLQGVRIPSAILKIVFRHILFVLFLMQFRLWRAAAFVSSLIHLLPIVWCMQPFFLLFILFTRPTHFCCLWQINVINIIVNVWSVPEHLECEVLQ